MLSSILDETTTIISLKEILFCSLTSIGLGLLVAFVHMYRNVYSKNFVITLAIMPLLVQSVIMLVNGNLGTGMAVLGAFSLVRFRSVAGGAREIGSIFWAMGIGLATGMGYLVYIVLFCIIAAAFFILLNSVELPFKQRSVIRQVKITIPENLDYPHLFDDLFEEYAYSYTLDQVRTTNMGSLYELTYQMVLKNMNDEKQLIDSIRVRNGNLKVLIGKVSTVKDEL